MRDFKVQAGYVSIANGASSVTITAGVDYDAPASSSVAFCRFTGNLNTSGGRIAASSDNPASELVNITNPGNITTSLTFTRNGTSLLTYISWEIVEYIGGQGGPNEIAVRHQEVLSMSSSTTTTDSSTVSGVLDPEKVVCFACSCTTDSTSTSGAYNAFATLEYISGSDVVRATRVANNAAMDVTIAAVEFIGENWEVQRVLETCTLEYNNPVNISYVDPDKVFTHTQLRATTSTETLLYVRVINAYSDEVIIKNGGTGGTGGTVAVWIVHNLEPGGEDSNALVSNTYGAWVSNNQGAPARFAAGDDFEDWDGLSYSTDNYTPRNPEVSITVTGNGEDWMPTTHKLRHKAHVRVWYSGVLEDVITDVYEMFGIWEAWNPTNDGQLDVQITVFRWPSTPDTVKKIEPLLTFRKPWTKQPPLSAKPAITGNNLVFFDCREPVVAYHNGIRHLPVFRLGTNLFKQRATPYGMGYGDGVDGETQRDTFDFPSWEVRTDITELTIVNWLVHDSDTTAEQCMLGKSSTNSIGWRFSYIRTSSSINWRVPESSVAGISIDILTDPKVNIGDLVQVVGRWKSGYLISLDFYNATTGEKVHTESAVTATNVTTNTGDILWGNHTGNAEFEQIGLYNILEERYWSDQEIEENRHNMWQIFEPQTFIVPAGDAVKRRVVTF